MNPKYVFCGTQLKKDNMLWRVEEMTHEKNRTNLNPKTLFVDALLLDVLFFILTQRHRPRG